MNLKSVFCSFILFVSALSMAQITSEDVLFTVDEAPVYASEFVRVYNKNLDLVKDESQKDVDAYLQLFINYKLKLEEAKSLKLDEKPSYKREFKSYRNQLAQNYLTDNKVTEELVEEAYHRLEYDIKARHVLVRVEPNASAKDTLEAYMKIVKLRKRLIDDGFDKLKTDVHDGKAIFAEELGYFTAFKMVYKFENAAYNTQVGDVSQPFRTRFGYHVVQVEDKRASRGTVTVAHIMVAKNKPGDTISNPEARIQDIYKKLNQGEKFETLAKQFSDDKSSAANGGELAPFSSGQLSSSEFEDVAFSLTNPGDVSKPFKSNYGWHIVKLIDHKPLPLLVDLKDELENKVLHDSRSERISETRVKDLKVKYNVPEIQPALPYFVKLLNKNYYSNTWQLPANFTANKTLLTLGDTLITYNAFGTYLEKHQTQFAAKTPYKQIVEVNYNNFLEAELKQYQENHLELENEEFGQIVAEYRDGLLLFDLMETEIWNVANTDTLAIEAYYNTHKANYKWNKRIDAIIASGMDKKDIKKVSKMLKKNLPLDAITSQININNEVHVIFTSGIMEATHQGLPENFDFKTGISKIYPFNEGYMVAKVNNVLPETIKTYEEAKGLVISDFQAEKEDRWLQDLHAKYSVKIDDAVLTKVRNQINNQ